MTAAALFWRFDRRTRVSLTSSLASVAQQLEGLSRSTEADFLEVGSRLERIVSNVRAEAGAIAGMQDTVDRQRQPVLTKVLDDVCAWSGQSRQSTGSEALFAALEPVVGALGVPLDTLRNSVRMLLFVGLSTRIESAWLGGRAANFEALGAEVRSLADGIEAKAAELMQAREAMSRLLATTRRTVAGQERTQRARMVRLAAECAAGLDELRRDQDRISEMSLGARADYEKVARAIAEIVFASQSHDSFRQRLEHIVEALGRGAESLTGQSGIAPPGSARQSVELQLVQLRQARETFVGAIGEMRRDLTRIRDIVSDYPRRSRQLLGSEQGNGKDATSRIQARFLTLSETMRELGESRQILAAAAAEVKAACARMVGFVADIETLGSRLIRLGLNAEVQAVRLAGSDGGFASGGAVLANSGAVMESVASSIRRTAQSASDSAREAGAALLQLEAPAARLAATLVGGADAADRDPDAMAARLLQTSEELNSTHAENGRLLAQIALGAESLSGELSTLLGGITADEVTERVASACVNALETVAGTLRAKAGRNSRAPSPAPEAAAGALDLSTVSYTMRAERDAHQSFTGSTSVGDGAADGAADEVAVAVALAQPAGCPAEFDDNVELF